VQQYMTDLQLAERYQISRATVWRWTKNGLLPPPVQLSGGTTRWSKDQIERRDAERQQSAGRSGDA
jgi:prophage regulatory protein